MHIIIVLIVQRDVYGVREHRHWSTELGTTQGQGLGARLVSDGGRRGVHFFLGPIIIIIVIIVTSYYGYSVQATTGGGESDTVPQAAPTEKESDEIYASVLFFSSINHVPAGNGE